MMRRRAYGDILPNIIFRSELSSFVSGKIRFFTWFIVEYTNEDGNVVSKKQYDKLNIASCIPNVDINIYIKGNTTTVALNDSKITDILVRNISGLRSFSCVNNSTLKELIIENQPSIETLNCYINSLTDLDISKLNNLKSLTCYNGKINYLAVDKCPKLSTLSCYANKLTALDLSKNLELTSLTCGSNIFATEDDEGKIYLDVSNNTKLTYLSCGKCNIDYIKGLDLLTELVTFFPYCQMATTPYSLNRYTSLDLRNNTKLETIYLSAHYLTELWLPTPDENNSSKIKWISTYNSFVQNQPPLTIHNLSGVNMTSELNLWSYTLQGDYDLSNVKGYAITSGSFSIISVKATGHIKVPDFINREWIYNVNHTNTSPYLFIIDCPTFEVVCEDGTIISDKSEYYKHIAQVIKDEGLYDYPQMCKIIYPNFGLTETRDLYETVKVITCDSGMHNSWQNKYGNSGTNTQFNLLSWKPSKDTIGNKNSITKLRLVINGNADLFITNFWNGYAVHDTRQRFVTENGELVGKNGAVVGEKNILDNGDIEYILQITLTDSTLSSYYIYAYLFENIYPSESDPYISKIVSFEKIE